MFVGSIPFCFFLCVGCNINNYYPLHPPPSFVFSHLPSNGFRYLLIPALISKLSNLKKKMLSRCNHSSLNSFTDFVNVIVVESRCVGRRSILDTTPVSKKKGIWGYSNVMYSQVNIHWDSLERLQGRRDRNVILLFFFYPLWKQHDQKEKDKHEIKIKNDEQKERKKDTTKEMCVYTDHVELPSCLSFENPKLFSVAAQIQKINKQIT